MYKKLLLLCLSISLFNCAYTQEVTETIINKLDDLRESKPSEQLYIQTSKDIYAPSEVLWFKVYLLSNINFSISGRNSILYLNLSDASGNIVMQEKYPIIDGYTEGHLELGSDIADGNYRLEVYSRGSLHIDTTKYIASISEHDKMYSSFRDIKIVDEILLYQPTITPQDSSLRFDLLPEGGNIVDGIPTCIAFKATNNHGYPVDVKGEVLENGACIYDFESSHDGMGSIFITPYADREYQVKLDNGKTYPLPQIYTEGVSLQMIDYSSEAVTFFVAQNKGAEPKKFYLLGQMRGLPCYLTENIVDDNYSEIVVPLADIPLQGIIEFTLLNKNLQPKAERLVYINPLKNLNISASFSKEEYGKREKVTLTIKTTDEHGSPVKANLGLSVFEEVYKDASNNSNILSYNFLTSQIRGNIHNPTSYFDPSNEDRFADMDLLLLTQGWRKYDWSINEEIKDEDPFILNEIPGTITMSDGKRKKAQMRAPSSLYNFVMNLPNTMHVVNVISNDRKAEIITTNLEGTNFTITTQTLNNLRGSNIYIKPMLKEAYRAKVTLEESFPLIDSVRNTLNYYSSLMTITKEYSIHNAPVKTSIFEDIITEEVEIRGRKREVFGANRDKFMKYVDSLEQELMNQAWVCDCHISYPNLYSKPFLNDYQHGYTHHPEGIAISPTYNRMRLKPEVGQSYVMVKLNEEGGQLVESARRITLFENIKFSDEHLLDVYNILKTKGFYGDRIFYEPNEDDINSPVPLSLSTLIWRPTIITDDNGEATITFFTTDLESEYLGIIEGSNGAGRLGTSTINLKVKQ